MNQSTEAPVAIRASWLRRFAATLVTVGVLASVYGWLLDAPFWRGVIPGIYWLSVAFYPVMLGLLILSTLAMIALFVLWLIRRKTPDGRHVLGSTALSLLAAFLMLVALYSSFLGSVHHRASLRANGHVYHLASIDLFIDTRFSLFTCGPLGVICTGDPLSGDYPGNYIAETRLQAPPGGDIVIVLCSNFGDCDVRFPGDDCNPFGGNNPCQ
jgi:hypothetical protein